ncbi:hypothetical protein [Bradyrhizobium diazoefficiens]
MTKASVFSTQRHDASVNHQAAPTRRQFATWMAAATAGAGAAAVAVPVTTLAAAPDDDAALLKLKERIFEAWHASNEHDDEIRRLERARAAKHEELEQEGMSADDRWALVFSLPEFQRLERLIESSQDHFDRMSVLIDKMWAVTALTEAGRAAKVSVLLTCILRWRDPDGEMDWHEFMARQLLVDLVGGEAAESLRQQFADAPSNEGVA